MKKLGDRPDVWRGDTVRVKEPGLHEWYGVVADVKPGEVSWRVSVRDEHGFTWSVSAERVESWDRR